MMTDGTEVTVKEPNRDQNPPQLVVSNKGTGNGAEKSNWALVLSIVSPLIMVVGLISGFSVYKERVDLITTVISPEFLVEYVRLQERVDELQEEIVFLQSIIRDEYLKENKK